MPVSFAPDRTSTRCAHRVVAGAAVLLLLPGVSLAQDVSDAPARFMVGLSQLRSREVADGAVQSAWGTALGLRLSYPAHTRIRGEVDVRLQVAGLRGPCTMNEAAREQCAFITGAQSIGDIAGSAGLSVAPVRGVRLSALVSPGANTRAVDRVVGAEHVNRSGHPLSLALGLEVPLYRSARLLLEYRALGAATYRPDPEAEEAVGAEPRDMRGDAFSAMISMPLRPTPTGMDAGDGLPHPAWTSFGLVVENDLPWRDEAYTNGVRAFVTEVPYVRRLLRAWHLGWQRDAIPCPYGGDAVPADTPFCRATQVAVTQTMHTPAAIYEHAPQPQDRPFAGTLFGSLRSDLLRPGADGRELLAIGSELQVGVMGPSAGSEATQSMAHWLISTRSARPAGWSNEPGDQFHLGALADFAYRGSGMSNAADSLSGVVRRLFNADLTLRANAVLGSTHRSASGGIVGRWGPFGRGLPLTTQRAVVPAKKFQKARPDSPDIQEVSYEATREFRYALVATLDGKLVGHNATLVGDDIDVRRALHELGMGAQLEWGWLAVTGIVVHRAREFAPAGGRFSGHARYWTAQLTYRPRIN